MYIIRNSWYDNGFPIAGVFRNQNNQRIIMVTNVPSGSHGKKQIWHGRKSQMSSLRMVCQWSMVNVMSLTLPETTSTASGACSLTAPWSPVSWATSLLFWIFLRIPQPPLMTPLLLRGCSKGVRQNYRDSFFDLKWTICSPFALSQCHCLSMQTSSTPEARSQIFVCSSASFSAFERFIVRSTAQLVVSKSTVSRDV